VVAIEYFTKQIEAKALVNIAAVGLKRFFWQHLICPTKAEAIKAVLEPKQRQSKALPTLNQKIC
jgi:hypothetical protein